MQKVENIVANGEIACFEQYFLFHNVFNSRLLHRPHKVSICGKGLINNRWLNNVESVKLIHTITFQCAISDNNVYQMLLSDMESSFNLLPCILSLIDLLNSINFFFSAMKSSAVGTSMLSFT